MIKFAFFGMPNSAYGTLMAEVQSHLGAEPETSTLRGSCEPLSRRLFKWYLASWALNDAAVVFTPDDCASLCSTLRYYRGLGETLLTCDVAGIEVLTLPFKRAALVFPGGVMFYFLRTEENMSIVRQHLGYHT